MISSGNTPYGTASGGGSGGSGTVFALNTNGTGFTTLYSFTASINSGLGILYNGDGANPEDGLVLSGNTLYGTTYSGGTSGIGTVSVYTDGSGLTSLHTFTAQFPQFIGFTNSDGAYPKGGLVLSGNILYGTAKLGGTSGWGTVFALSLPIPVVVRPLITWTNPAPITYGTALSSNQLDATASVPGSFAYTPPNGTVLNAGTNTLSVVFTPTDTVDFSSTTNTVSLVVSSATGTIACTFSNGLVNVILTWNDPTSVFGLQAAPSLKGIFTNIPSAASPYTNIITGTDQFFRLMAK